MSARDGAVVELAIAVWNDRDQGMLCRDAGVMARRMYLAVAMDACDGYDPELDLRVAWLRQVIAGLRRGERVPRADATMEEWVAFTLGVKEAEEKPVDFKLAAAGGW